MASMLLAMAGNLWMVCDGLAMPGIVSNRRTYPQHVVHQRAAAGPNLDQLDALAPAALGHPLGDEPDATELAKDLGDLGRGHEVALEAELVAALLECAGVVAANVSREAHAHEAG